MTPTFELTVCLDNPLHMRSVEVALGPVLMELLGSGDLYVSDGLYGFEIAPHLFYLFDGSPFGDAIRALQRASVREGE